MLGDTLSLYLQGEGYDVIRVDNARDGLLQLQARPDILLLDLMLPDSGNKNPCSTHAPTYSHTYHRHLFVNRCF